MIPRWEKQGIALYQGDCLEVIPAVAGGVDAIITDPPYFLPAFHYNTRSEQGRSLADLGMLEHFYQHVFRVALGVCSPSAVLYVFCDGQSYPVFYALLYPHVRRLVPLVWDKVVSINGFSWRHQHELLLYAECAEAKSVPTGDGDVIRCRAVPIKGRIHPAQKPVSLLRKLIEKSVPQGGLILDPFAGSGSTLVAAWQSGLYRCIGIEKDETYCAAAAQRLSMELSDD